MISYCGLLSMNLLKQDRPKAKILLGGLAIL